MCRTQCISILALVAIFVGLAHSTSWDFATASHTHLDFYFRGNKKYTEKITTGDITKITYDPVGNRMFFINDEDKSNFIFSYDMTTKITEPLVRKPHESQKIASIAFDPVDQILFWKIYYHGTIYWLSLKSRFENTVSGNILIETSYGGPSAMTIDSCRGYIYWSSTDQENEILPSLIERVRFDGSGREIIIETGLKMPESLIMDPQTQRLYWADGTQAARSLPTEYKYYTIESADLNGNNRTVLYRQTGIDQPDSLTVSEDYIYWSHWYTEIAMLLPKNPSKHEKPTEIPIMLWPVIVTNYKIEQQIKGVPDCDRLNSLLQNETSAVENESVTVATDTCLDCVHGTKASGESQCKCEHGYVGEKCDVPLCHNYCFQGDCIVSDEGGPQCRCNAGYFGQRCEINVCQGYCLNAGDCSLNEANAPICRCQADYVGERCEVSACLNRLNKHFQTVSLLRDVLDADSPGILDKRVKSTCASNIF